MPQSAQARQIEQIQDDFADAVKIGLSSTPKEIPCSYLYDDRGSELFEDITRTHDYYPTRTEIWLLEKYANEIAEFVGPGCSLIEFGSGSSRKTQILIETLPDLKAYVPIDISDGALNEAEEKLNGRYPRLVVVPLHADFNQPMDLPNVVSRTTRLGFFPGSTLGNFSRSEAQKFLSRAAKLLGRDAALLIGIDLKKDIARLERAYDDSEGVTASFTLNLLSRINRELDGDFDLSTFKHVAAYNEKEGRIEIFLESLKDQSVHVLGETYHFAKGERMQTENSHKYSIGEFRALAEKSGWTPQMAWVDPENLFSIHLLRTA